MVDSIKNSFSRLFESSLNKQDTRTRIGIKMNIIYLILN